jgi:hypothetical protein
VLAVASEVLTHDQRCKNKDDAQVKEAELLQQYCFALRMLRRC